MPSIQRITLFAVLFFCGLALHAQQTTVTFKVINVKKEPLPFATVTVVPIPDSVNKIEKLTDSTGSVSFNLVALRPYSVTVSSVNYQPVTKNITTKEVNLSFTIVAEAATKELSNVVVTSSRPLMRQQDDKTIVDPESLALSSTNAFEIMEKVPGLFVDQDGNIYLSGTTPAMVYINGREQRMSTADVATMLKSLPPGAIASIEILRTPSARYDAAGSGGIVNVVLKKGVRLGLTGSANAGFNQGKYGNQFVGLNINNNNGRLTTTLNLQYSRRNTYELINTNRLFAPDSVLQQNAFTRFPTTSYYLGYGVSYQLSKKWDISYDGRLTVNNSQNRSTNISDIVKRSTNATILTRVTDINNDITSYNTAQSGTLKYKIDSLGSEWTTDLSYTFAPNNTRQFFTTGDGILDNSLQFFSAQTNLVKKLAHKITVEAGIKSTAVWFKNNTDFFFSNNTSRVKDNGRTGAFKYTENINAAYLQVSKNIKGIVVKTGLRVENTNMQGNQLEPLDTSFVIQRTDPFPYVYISRNLTKIAGYDLRAYLVYRRTISRPVYEYLNPFPRYIDPFLSEVGNPTLRPQFTQNYEANISVDERPIFAVGVNETKDIFTQVLYQADSTRSVAFRTYDNLGNNKETYFRILGAIPPGKRYFFVAGAMYMHNLYNGFYEGKPLSFNRGSWAVFNYQTFKVTKTTQLVLNGFVRFNGQQQFFELSTFGALNLSLSQQLFKKKLTASISATDLFFTNNNDFVLTQGTVNAVGYREGDTRRFGVNLRYNFGFRKREERNLFNIESPEKTAQ